MGVQFLGQCNTRGHFSLPILSLYDLLRTQGSVQRLNEETCGFYARLVDLSTKDLIAPF